MTLIKLQIRPAIKSDQEAVLQVHRDAFGEEDEAELVDHLLHDLSAHPLISMVALKNELVIGHILLTKTSIEGSDEAVSSMILAPLAVIPEKQKMGVGSGLIEHALKQARSQGVDLVFALGHPTYYPRSGFAPAGRHGLNAPYPIPPKNADAWMVIELTPGLIGSVKGTVLCAKTMDRPEYWRE